jgi:hypothetical protein
MMIAKLVLLAALLAQAAPPPTGNGDKAKAKVLLQEGLAANRQSQHAQALEKFQAAYAAYPSPKLWFNIGQVELALDHSVEAIQAFEKFLALVPGAQPDEKKIARSSVEQLRKKLGQLEVKCETNGAEITVDGKSVGRVPLAGPVWAAPGSHRVAITQEGFSPASETLDLRAGTSALVVIHLVPLAPPKPEPKSEVATLAAEPKQAPAPSPPPAPVDLEPVPASPPEPTPAALDLTVQPAPEAAAETTPIYKKWWFWTGAALVVAGAVTATLLLTRSGGSNVPKTDFDDHEVFQ